MLSSTLLDLKDSAAGDTFVLLPRDALMQLFEVERLILRHYIGFPG